MKTLAPYKKPNPPITQHADTLRCNHWWRRRSQWYEYGVELVVCDGCLKTIFHMIELNAYWAARDASEETKKELDPYA